MCGRFTHLFTWRELHRLLSLTSPSEPLVNSYNVAPTQKAPVVRTDSAGGGSGASGGGRRADLLRWGLVPHWAKDRAIGSSLINARAETIATKPAFRAAFKSRRCLIPVSGFFEWRVLAEGKPKQPYYITSAAPAPLLLAGLWEHWSPTGPATTQSADTVETFTIITTTPNELLAPLHDRMPAILSDEDLELWLDPATPAEVLAPLLRPYPAALMLARPVSTRVNSPRNNDPSCIAPLAPAP